MSIQHTNTKQKPLATQSTEKIESIKRIKRERSKENYDTLKQKIREGCSFTIEAQEVKQSYRLLRRWTGEDGVFFYGVSNYASREFQMPPSYSKSMDIRSPYGIRNKNIYHRYWYTVGVWSSALPEMTRMEMNTCRSMVCLRKLQESGKVIIQLSNEMLNFENIKIFYDRFVIEKENCTDEEICSQYTLFREALQRFGITSEQYKSIITVALKTMIYPVFCIATGQIISGFPWARSIQSYQAQLFPRRKVRFTIAKLTT